MTTRRNFVRTAVALPALAAVPVGAAVCAADPSIVAIKDYQEARRLYLAAIDRDEQRRRLTGSTVLNASRCYGPLHRPHVGCGLPGLLRFRELAQDRIGRGPR